MVIKSYSKINLLKINQYFLAENLCTNNQTVQDVNKPKAENQKDSRKKSSSDSSMITENKIFNIYI